VDKFWSWSISRSKLVVDMRQIIVIWKFVVAIIILLLDYG
jgi:hypothetical protein